MPTEPARTQITLHGDLRFVAAVGAAVAHAGNRLGLEGEAESLSASAMNVVREIFARLGNRGGAQQPNVQVVIEDQPGSLQVTIEHASDAASAAHAPSGAEKIWDQSKFESRNGASRIVLTKFTGAKPPEG